MERAEFGGNKAFVSYTLDRGESNEKKAIQDARYAFAQRLVTGLQISKSLERIAPLAYLSFRYSYPRCVNMYDALYAKGIRCISADLEADQMMINQMQMKLLR